MARTQIEAARPVVLAALAPADGLDERALAELVDDHGMTQRFSDGAYLVRIGGLGGQSTMSVRAALQSWLRAAERRLS